MTHPYPPHHPTIPYTGKHHYSLTFCTEERRRIFVEPERVALVYAQFLRAAREHEYAFIVYCFMPDHVRLVVRGETEDADCKAFITTLKQYSGYYFEQEHRHRLWQRYGFEHVIRDAMELALTIGYIVANP